jgi:hypothetical protein
MVAYLVKPPMEVGSLAHEVNYNSPLDNRGEIGYAMRSIITLQPFLVAPILLGLTLGASPVPSWADEAMRTVKLEKTWEGEVSIELRGEAPEKGYIADEDAWARRWKTYRGDEKLPWVDFKTNLILVAVSKDLNRIWIKARVDNEGDLEIWHGSTCRPTMLECNHHRMPQFVCWRNRREL